MGRPRKKVEEPVPEDRIRASEIASIKEEPQTGIADVDITVEENETVIDEMPAAEEVKIEVPPEVYTGEVHPDPNIVVEKVSYNLDDYVEYSYYNIDIMGSDCARMKTIAHVKKVPSQEAYCTFSEADRKAIVRAVITDNISKSDKVQYKSCVELSIGSGGKRYFITEFDPERIITCWNMLKGIITAEEFVSAMFTALDTTKPILSSDFKHIILG